MVTKTCILEKEMKGSPAPYHATDPFERQEILEDIEWLLANPNSVMISKYHDAGSCWKLIEEMTTNFCFI